MPARSPFQYAALRIVPRVERGEARQRRRRPLLPPAALPRRAHAARRARCSPRSRPTATRPPSRELLRAVELIAAGDAAGGPIAALPASERFHWLVAPASTIVQPGPVHTGLTSDPAAELDHLFAQARGTLTPPRVVVCVDSDVCRLDSISPDALPDVLELRTADLLRQRGDVPGVRDAAAPLRPAGRAAPEPRTPRSHAKLAMARRELAADAALLSEIRGGREHVRWAVGGRLRGRRRAAARHDLRAPAGRPHRRASWQTPRREPAVRDLPAVRDGDIRAYIGVPFETPDARAYVLCCLAYEARPDLGESDVRFLQGLVESLRPLLELA